MLAFALAGSWACATTIPVEGTFHSGHGTGALFFAGPDITWSFQMNGYGATIVKYPPCVTGEPCDLSSDLRVWSILEDSYQITYQGQTVRDFAASPNAPDGGRTGGTFEWTAPLVVLGDPPAEVRVPIQVSGVLSAWRGTFGIDASRDYVLRDAVLTATGIATYSDQVQTSSDGTLRLFRFVAGSFAGTLEVATEIPEPSTMAPTAIVAAMLLVRRLRK